MAVLEGFFVSLGFQVDRDSQARFNAAIQNAGAKVAAFGKGAAGVAAKLGAEWLKSTQALSKDFISAKFANSSVSGMKTLGMAIKAVGGNAAAVEGALADMAQRARTLPGYAAQIKNVWGVSLTDASGKARDMSEVLSEIGLRMQDMDDATVAARASATGLGNVWQFMKDKRFPEELRKAREQTVTLGAGLDQTAESANSVWVALGRVFDLCKMGFSYLVGYLDKVFNITGWLDNLAKKLPGWIQSGSQSVAAGIETAKKIFSRDDWLDATGDEIADEYRKQLKARKEDDAAGFMQPTEAPIAGGGSMSGGTGSEPWWNPSGTPAPLPAAGSGGALPVKNGKIPRVKSLAAAPAGIRNFNPGNIRNSKTDDGFAHYRTLEEGFFQMGRQLKMYQNAGARTITDIIRTWAPKSENNTAAYIQSVADYLSQRLGQRVGRFSAVNLSDPRQMQAFMEAITRHENGEGWQNLLTGGRFSAEIARAAAVTRKSGVYDSRKNSPVTSNVVVNIGSANASPKQIENAVRNGVNSGYRAAVRGIA